MNFEPTKENISLHGLGFLQVKLGGDQRLHVWHPDLPRRACFEHSQIHDHRFGFSSTVLKGTQVNHVYACCSLEYNRDASHMAYLHEGERLPTGNRPWLPNGELLVQSSYSEVVEEGEKYLMPQYVFHSTEPGGDGRVATLMTKLSESQKGARSLCTLGVEPDTEFDRQQMLPVHMWDIVNEVLGS